MNPERWRRVKELMLSAAERGPAQRARFLDEACGEDSTLRRQVESLVLADARASTFLESPAFQVSRAVPEPGDRVGPYELLREIGSGGMGTVFLAVRSGDEYRNEVAVKILKPGLATDEIRRRFHTEGRILAGLEHSGVARLFEGGTTAGGLPYLAMEYVRGEPIDRYCDARALGVDERLRLFRRVCSAVQFAHRNLVVHRDLKPSNILVSDDGTPKLLDFGIAKLLAPDPVRSPPALTVPEQRPMTPEYASPEQVRGEAITTASDVFSLGLVLYVLLTGRHPYRPRGRQLAEIVRVICDEEPARPSAAVGERGGRRRLEGDLDAIVLRALRKEPEKRYASVEQLSDDVDRHLAGLPVLARKGTFTYRMGKLVRRHAAAVASLVTLVGLALAIAVILAFQHRHIARERDRAEHVSEFLVDLFEATDPGKTRGETITAREILDRGTAKIRQSLEDQDELKATLIDTMGRAYMNLGLFDGAAELFEQSLAVRRQVLGERHPDVAASLHHLGQIAYAKGEYREAEDRLRAALAIRLDRRGPDHPDVADTLDELAAARLSQSDFDGAEELLYRALEIRRRHDDGRGESAVSSTLRHLARVAVSKGKLDEAVSRARESLAAARAAYGSKHPEVAAGLHQLALVHMARGSYGEAEARCREALAQRRRLFEPGHYEITASLHTLAQLSKRRGDYRDAEALYREVLEINRRLLGEDHANVATPMHNLAKVLVAEGRYSAAEPLFRDALAIYRRVFGDRHPAVATGLDSLGTVLRETSDLAGAEALHREALAVRRELFGDAHLHVAVSLRNLGRIEAAKGRRDAAEAYFQEALAMTRSAVGSEHPRVAGLLDDLARSLSSHDPGTAETLARRALALRRGLLGDAHPDVAMSLATLAAALAAGGDCAAAEPLASDALQRLRRKVPGQHRRIAEVRETLAACRSAPRDPSAFE